MAEQHEHWTPKLVQDRLEEAAATLKRLPDDAPRDTRACWPTVVREFWESYGYDKPRVKRGPPPPDAITRMDECLVWLRWLEPAQVRLVWARAERIQWKQIMAQLGVCRETARQRYLLAMATLSARLNQNNA